MSVFRRRGHRHSQHGSHSYHFRVDTRRKLLEGADLQTMDDGKGETTEQERLARVLEQVTSDSWRLIGVSDQDFIFRRRS